MELLSHMATLRLTFLRNCQIVFQSHYIILQSYQQWMRFQVSTSLPTLVIIWHFVYSQPSECEVISHYINHSFQNVSHIMSLPFPQRPDGTTLLVNSEFLQWLLKPYVKALIHPPRLPTQLLPDTLPFSFCPAWPQRLCSYCFST